MRERPDPSLSDVIRDAFRQAVDSRGQAAVSRETGVSTSTVGRWTEKDGFRLNTKTLDAVARLDEVQIAVAERMLNAPSEDTAAWQIVAAKLSDLISPAAAHELARLLREMKELGILSSEFGILRGAIEQRRTALEEIERAKTIDASQSRRRGNRS